MGSTKVNLYKKSSFNKHNMKRLDDINRLYYEVLRNSKYNRLPDNIIIEICSVMHINTRTNERRRFCNEHILE